MLPVKKVTGYQDAEGKLFAVKSEAERSNAEMALRKAINRSVDYASDPHDSLTEDEMLEWMRNNSTLITDYLKMFK